MYKSDKNISKLILICLIFGIFVVSMSCQVSDLEHAQENSKNISSKRLNNFTTVQEKTYDDFIDNLWKFESSIDPAQQTWYNQNWNNEVIDSYPKVDFSGRVVRDNATGDPVQQYNLTVKEYFTSIGIVDLYSPSDPNPDWKKIQASVINYLGFVGFQFQESDLVDLGYYNYDKYIIKNVSYPMHYVDVPNYHWENGVRLFLDTNPAEVSEATAVTDTVNYKDDLFTGKNGIYSVADFKDPSKHIYVIKDHFIYKYNRIVAELKAEGKSLNDYLGTIVTWNGLTPPVAPPPGGRSNEVTITMSGLLAGAHLRGAKGVVDMLVYHKNPQDESGTYILQYVQDYAGYDTPFSNNQSKLN